MDPSQDPATVVREKHGKTLNMGRKQPRPSDEALQYYKEKAQVQEALDPVFQWLRETVSFWSLFLLCKFVRMCANSIYS